MTRRSYAAELTDRASLAALVPKLFYADLTAWIFVLSAALNAYMDSSLRATTGGKYYPEGWS